ncbi:type I-D CRISPR-associated helicase Cas3' [Leptolyngbya sp. NK1-12]|uniref:Type I-D CRISPR-associated helicase Cas3 n=1 Tax=Leptolyngbya sp. NK1-12 TaxID=2547451 RepID=A0AA96WR98_9CYAN|nr:type I-D CRISPR-associated helicase Cas3' [Leptolyngbya sp. NK1-12]WNZ27821.1 type I-D CRISPR-associated helicase Cas3' [Leptolyngbya sp. NK1-12]
MAYPITLHPVYSCPAEACFDIQLPAGWSLVWHQIETLTALRDPDVDVVFNTAMTGDGKSLAAQLSVLQGDCTAIALYPTNELARDQESQTQRYIDLFEPQNEPRVVRLSGATLETYAENEELRKSAAISTHSGQAELLLTNPDIFHYLHRGAYLIPGDSPDKLWGRIDKDFDLFIFDEFHVFAAPQISSVINTMLLIRSTNRRKKFLFLSATPDEALMQRLRQAGFRCRVINPIEQGKYQFPVTPEQQEQLVAANWRRVAGSIQLNFVPIESSAKASETWLKQNVDLILEQFQTHPSSKGAIILNSIAAIKRLLPFFQAALQPHGLVVGENTGLSGQQTRAASLAADLVLGTSTIDVGVDFKINFLIFESADAGNFIQRLGRLGRHEGYDQAGEFVQFDGFVAYALVPNFFVERLFAGDTPPLTPDGVYDRPFLHSTIWEKYRSINSFQGYYRRWGAFQSLSLGRKLSHKTIQQQYAGSLAAFKQQAEQVFDCKFNELNSRVRDWEREWQQLSGQTKGNPIYEDAQSFRGSSPLQCGLYDLSEPNVADRFKTYDLSGILSNLEIESWTEAAFMRTLNETAQQIGQPIPKGRFAHCLAFFKLLGYREERLDWKFTYGSGLSSVAAAWRVQVLKGIEIWQPNNRWAVEINRRLCKQALVCYVVPHPVSEVRFKLRLPMHFQIYPISDPSSYHDPVAPYSIAFEQSAMLLDTLAYQLRRRQGGEAIFL